MNKDAPVIAANETGAGGTGGTVRVKTHKAVVALGGVVGFAVGILNFMVITRGWAWALKGYFDILDSPIVSLKDWGFYAHGGPAFQGYKFGTQRAIVFYWIAIGLFSGWFIFLARSGVIGSVVRDRICRSTLFFGAVGGMFIGSLKFLAESNGWRVLAECLDGLDRPAEALMITLNVRFDILNSIPGDPRVRAFICLRLLAVAYWALICLFLALFFCIMRILKKRKPAREARVSEE